MNLTSEDTLKKTLNQKQKTSNVNKDFGKNCIVTGEKNIILLIVPPVWYVRLSQYRW